MKPEENKPSCVDDSLTAYLHGELDSKRTLQVARHLNVCPRCRSNFELVQRAARAAETLGQVPAPDSLWEAVETDLERIPESPARSRWPLYVALATAAALVVAVGLRWIYRPLPSQTVVAVEGTPRIGSEAIGQTGRLSVGEWLVTDSSARARIVVEGIGEVDVEPETRLRLIKSGKTEQRLSLDHGKIQARIWAPPRLFFVETPAALAVDLGCAYSLQVEPNGSGLLQVTSGWVGLEKEQRDVLVPAGAACHIDARQGPGVPFFEDAPPALRKLLREWPAGGAQALLDALPQARPRDAFSLWHLLFHLQREQREPVYHRMETLVPPPAGVGLRQALDLDQRALLKWREVMEQKLLGGILKGKKKLPPGLHPLASMKTARGAHTATPLREGQVLVTGGEDGSRQIGEAEIFYPYKNFSAPVSSLLTARSRHTVTLLSDGSALVAGGRGASGVLASAERYDPAARSFRAVGSMNSARSDHQATRLTNGRVLLTGGEGPDGRALTSAEIFDPVSGEFREIAPMAYPRRGHTATLLQDGRVLILGGGVRESEIFDPPRETFHVASKAGLGRVGHAAERLADGNILVLGGLDLAGQALTDCEIYSPRQDSFAHCPNLPEPRAGIAGSVARLRDGRILVAGGSASLRIFDPQNGTWQAVPGRLEPVRSGATATLLPTGQVLLLGGLETGGRALSEVWLFQP